MDARVFRCDRAVGLLAIIGGGEGLYLGAAAMDRLSIGGVLGIAFFTMALVSGALVLRGRRLGVPLLVAVQVLQVPVVVPDGVYSWKVAVGPSIIVGMSGPILRVLVDSWSFFQVVSDYGERHLAGVNLVAAVWVWYFASVRGRWMKSTAPMGGRHRYT